MKRTPSAMPCRDVHVVTPAADRPELYAWAWERAAYEALDQGRVTVAVGYTENGFLHVCRGGCCWQRPGSFIAVPDVAAAEFAANGEDVTADGAHLFVLTHHRTGRSAYIYEGGARRAADAS